MAKPSSKQQLQAKVGSLTLGKIQFTNKLRRPLIFELASSRADLMLPTTEQVSFRAQETQTLELDIFPQSKKGVGEVFLYVSDAEQYVQECIALEILYA